MDQAELLQSITSWAQADKNVLALIITGSHGRQPKVTDEYSDYNLEIIAENPNRLSQDDRWLHEFGPVWVSRYVDEGHPHPTRSVYYQDGLKVDFMLAGPDRITAMIEAGQLEDLYERGYGVLLDKTNITADLPTANGAQPVHALPTSEELTATMTEFWFEAMHQPKYLAREDLWAVKQRTRTMLDLLLKLLEWHALATHDGDVDVWHDGLNMKQWVDATTWEELQYVYGRFDKGDSWLGLTALTQLFARLTREIATELNLNYPLDIQENALGYLTAQNRANGPAS